MISDACLNFSIDDVNIDTSLEYIDNVLRALFDKHAPLSSRMVSGRPKSP